MIRSKKGEESETMGISWIWFLILLGALIALTIFIVSQFNGFSLQ